MRKGSWLMAVLLAAAASSMAAAPAAADHESVAASGTAAFRAAGRGVDEDRVPGIRRCIGAQETPSWPSYHRQASGPSSPEPPNPIVALASLAGANPDWETLSFDF